VGDEGEMKVEINHQLALAVNMPGSQVFALPGWDPSLRLTVFEDLARTEAALRTGDVVTLRETIEPLERMHAHLVTQRAKMGSRMFAVSATLGALERQNIQAQSLNASLEDADIAKTVVDLTREETLYKTALQASKHLLQPSLLEYLR
jgi:flagellar hook-associated protein 3 FlgL